MASGLSAREIVARFGGHPARGCGLELDTERGRAGWLLLAALLAGREGEPQVASAWEALRAAELAVPEAVADAVPERVASLLADCGWRRAEAAGALLVRLGRGLRERGGSLETLAAEAEGLEGLGEALVRLAPGFGSATVLRFLRPLRGHWPAALETPLDPAARAAADHLGWLPAEADPEGHAAALAAILAREDAAPALADVEAALARLGRAACRADRPGRCPLGDDCPRRSAA